MLSNKNVISLSLIFASIAWLSLLVSNLIFRIGINHFEPFFSVDLNKIFLSFFFVFLYLYFQFHIGKAESINFLDLLWRVFVTGMFTSLVSIVFRFVFNLFGGNLIRKELFLTIFYHINIGLIVVFLLSTYTVWQRLILYHKSKTLVLLWKIFEYVLLISILFIFFDYNFFDIVFNVLYFVLLGLGVVLSVNLKWVAYLNFKQKWKSILILTLVIIYLWYFFTNLIDFKLGSLVLIDLEKNVFILALFTFIFLYAVFSLLVILFNLPTSSVFEQKLEEVINFQRLSQSIQTEQKEEQVYEILINSSINSVLAEAGWLEIKRSSSEKEVFIVRNITSEEIEEVKTAVSKTKIKTLFDTSVDVSQKINQLTTTLKGVPYRSILAIPLIVQGKQIGSLALLKKVSDGFNKEMTDIVSTFTNQACISLENFRLLGEVLGNERYKEELKIARRVQQSLLPKSLDSNDHFDITAFSEAADEVGGDYYDTYWIDENKKALIIGDVSGKGTSAAFHMSQLKGVFHSLVQFNFPPKDFLIYANNALSNCLEKTSFITVSYYVIDTKDKRIEFARAGHCPTLMYRNSEQKTYYFKNKGLGLGILRNTNFHKYVEVNTISYNSGDIIILYTDGIVEARNEKNEEFGFDRLQKFLKQNYVEDPVALQNSLIKEVYDFCGKKALDDDYTVIIIKFK